MQMMNRPSTSQITTQLFLGALLSPDIGMALHQNPLWRQEQVASSDSRPLTKAQYQGKEYIGCALPSACVTLKELAQFEAEIQTQLSHYLPDKDIQKIRLYCFGQLFVR